MDPVEYRALLSDLLKGWQQTFEEGARQSILAGLKPAGSALPKPQLQRWGCHYYSATLGSWLRQINYRLTDPTKRISDLDWEKRFRALRRGWEWVYDLSPRRLNWLSCHALTKPTMLFVQNDRITNLAKPLDTGRAVFAQIPASLGHVVAKAYLTPANDLLHPREVLSPAAPAPSKYLYDVDELRKRWTEIGALATELAEELKLQFWHSGDPLVATMLASGSAPAAKARVATMRARSLCFTLLPSLADNLFDNAKANYFYVCLPWKMGVAPATGAAGSASSSELGNMALVYRLERPIHTIDTDALQRMLDSFTASTRATGC